MGDINFLDDAQPSKRRRSRSRDLDIAYTTGQKVRAEPKPTAPDRRRKPTQTSKKKLSFFEWRTRHHQSDQAVQSPLTQHTGVRGQSDNAPDLQQVVAVRQHPVNQAAPTIDLHNLPTPPRPQADHHGKRLFAMPAPDLARQDHPTGKPARQAESHHGQKVHPDPKRRRLNVNLLPEEVVRAVSTRNYWRDLTYVAIGSAAAVCLLFIGLKVYEQKINGDITTVEQSITQVNNQINQFSETRIAATNTHDQLDALDAVLNHHITWDMILNLIEDATLPTVYYTNMTVSLSLGQITLQAIAPAYTQVEQQVHAFEQAKPVVGVSASSAQAIALNKPDDAASSSDTTVIEAVSFTLSLDVDSSQFVIAPSDL